MNELSCLLEGILFASGEPVYAQKLMQVLGVDASWHSSWQTAMTRKSGAFS